jgi:Arc/MetJ family transcription regulator
MKRTNLVLDDVLLKEATQVLGMKTYSATVNLALKEALRLRRIQTIPGFFGRLTWTGDLAEMREDRVTPARGKRRARS